MTCIVCGNPDCELEMSHEDVENTVKHFLEKGGKLISKKELYESIMNVEKYIIKDLKS
jgi:hypothetical protein